MDGLWTVEQVLALAPDPAAARAARGLAAANRWSGLGRDELAVWGACLGSGSRPYDVAVDLGGPAYRCSCPSRKIPCKHVLGLLLRWAGGTVPAGAPPGAVADWLTGRRERAGRGVERAAERAVERAAGGDGGQAREQTAARRAARIGDGLVELDRWLRDLVRQGLGTAQAQPYTFWDAMAARMVDAQAPGVAGRLRRMGGIAAGGGAGWPGRLLAEAGLLHLAAAAWPRLGRLPAGLRAELHTVVGWPHRSEEVLAGPVTRDRWTVLACQTERDDRLQERRTWLWGLTSGRPALLLDFAPTRGGFATAAPPVGAEIDAELAFYPGGAPLRALVSAVHGTRGTRLADPAPAQGAGHGADPAPARGSGQGPAQGPVQEAGQGAGQGLGQGSGQGRMQEAGHGADPAPGQAAGHGAAAGVTAWLGRHAEALARNPWLERYPMSLAGVVPERTAGGWALRDASGALLPVASGKGQGWVLAALAGGRPIGVAGEWRAEVLRPLSALAGDRLVSLDPPACGWPAAGDGAAWHRLASGDPQAATHSAEGATLWDELVTGALLGTARRAPELPAAAGALGDALARIGGTAPADLEGALLGAAATVAVWQRAGWRPAGTPAPAAGAPAAGAPAVPAGAAGSAPERLPRCGQAAGSRLARLLAPPDARDHSALLAEWLALASARGVRAPEELLPALLEHGRRRTGLQAAIWPVLGERGRWLAEQRAEWGWAAGPFQAEPAWHAAVSPDARLLAFGRLRAADPDRAREALAEAWAGLRGAEAATLLAVLGERLGPADEPFLEAALDHPAHKVREAAVELLTRLPGSRLAHRMSGRVSALFPVGGQPLARPAPVRLPAGGQLGIVRVPAPDAAATRDGIRERPSSGHGNPAWWLQQLAATAPVSAWALATGRSPAELVRLADLERDGYGEALLLGWVTAAARECDPLWTGALLEALDPADHPELLAALPAERAETLVLRALGTAAWGTHDRAWRLLRHYPSPWPERVQRTLLDLLVVAAGGRDADRSRLLWQYLGGFATRLDPALAVEAGAVLGPATAAPGWGRSVETFLDQLTFRHDLHAELA